MFKTKINGGLPSQLISRRSRVAIMAALVALSTGSSLMAATNYTWDGGAGPTDTNWTTAINWNPDATPTNTTGDTVFINGAGVDVTLAGSAVYYGFQLGDGATLTVNTGADVNSATAANTTNIGFSGTGTMIMNGGTFRPGTVNVGGLSGSTGLLTINGGTFSNTTAVGLGGNGSTGIVNITGGTFATAAFAISQNNGTGVATISGGTVNIASQIQVGVNGTANGTLNLQGGTVTVNSGAAEIQVANTATATGVVNIGTGGAYTTTLTTGAIRGVLGSATVNFNHTNTVAFSTVISGNMVVNKLAAGITQLTGTNTYTGATLVSAGTLLANSANSTGTGVVTVNSGAKLGGSGTIQGNVASSGIITPGDIGAVGNLSVTGATGVTWNGAANTANAWQFQLGAPGTSDKLIITNALTKGTGTVFAFDFLGGGAVGSYQLATFGSSNFVSSDFTAVNLGAGLSAAFTKAANSVSVTLTASAVPEPSTVATIAGAVILGYVVVRRRKTVSASA